ncbi:MAG: hypothetical protein RR551_05305 [Mucinivorans sp.]
MKRFLLILVVACATTFGVNAQQTFPERYGADPTKREENAKTYSYMQHAYTTKSYEDALGFFRKLVVDAPKISMNMYIWASDIYRGKLARATTKVERNTYLDTLLMIFDKRIENFGDHEKYGKPYLTAQKALMFNETDPSNQARAKKLFREAIAAGGKQVDPALLVTFFNSLTEGYKLDDVTAEEYLNSFEELTTLLSGISTEDATQAVASIESLFGTSGAASCENIENIFRPKYEADPNNETLVKQILALLSRNKCSSDFQLMLTEKYYAIEPSPSLAAMLGGIFEGKKDAEKALEYYKIAIAGETNPEYKLAYVLSAASASLGGSQYHDAAQYARQAIAMNEPKAGLAYLILAEAYAGGVRSCSGFEQQAAYWLVVDTFVQARAKLADQPEQVESINRMISSYSSNFPKVEDTFQRDMTPGQGYTVNCGWVSGRTTVRERR